MRSNFRVITLFYAVLLILSAPDTYGQIRIGETIDSLSYLNYSDGQVRLGSDKMGYIDSGVRLVVMDSVKDQYVVKLSRSWEAFIPKQFVGNIKEVTGDVDSLFDHLNSSWHLTSSENVDVLSLTFSEALPYRSIQEVSPNKIILDVFGARSNATWFTQLSKAKVIEHVQMEQLEQDVIRFHIHLRGKQNWGYALKYQNNSLQVHVKHPPAKLSLKNLHIAIDAGHGGSSTGAVGAQGTLEKEYNLLFALELQKLLLKKGVKKVYMTRTGDYEVSTTDRVRTLKGINPDILISLHLNASSNTQVSGVSTYYKQQQSKALASSILQQMLKLDLNEFGLIGNFNFLLNAPIEYPNTLVEIAFLSNPEDEEKVLQPAFHSKVAKQIYKGLKDWIKEIK